MTRAWTKAFRDLRIESARTLLVVVAIAAGIAGFASVLASYAILTRELNRGYLATNPASATLRTDLIDDQLLRVVASTRGVAEVEVRRTISGRIKGNTTGWRGLVLFVIRDFDRIRVSKLNRERGAWPPATGEILIERDAFGVARVRIGDIVRVRTRNGPERMLRVAGSVHDVGQAQARMENIVYGYVTAATLAQLGEEAKFNQLLLVVDGDKFDEQHIRNVANDVKRVVEANGHRVSAVDVPEPGKHPHAAIMGLLMLSLAAFGLFVMLLSGVIVVNLLTAMMAAQVRQIGVMKAIGGTRAQIARIYFTQALVLGATATIIALPLGIWGSRVLCRANAVLLNFDITSFAIPAWVFVLVVIAGTVVPLVAAAIPVLNGSSVSVRRALGEAGVSANHFGATRFDRLLASVGGFARPLLFALRNSFRRRTRLALTVATLAAGGVFFMTALNLRASMIHTLDRLFDTKKYDLSLSISGEARASDVLPIVRATRGVRAAEGWKASEGKGYVVIALSPSTQFMKPSISRGRWLAASDTDAMVINSSLASKSFTDSRVVGVVNEGFSPPTAYVPLRGDTINNVRIVLDTSDVEGVKALLEENLGRAGIKVAGISSKSDSRFSFDQHMLMIYIALIIMSALIGGVGGLGLMTTMSLNVLERRREMGVLRAVGATPRAIWLMLVAESAMAGVLSWAIASLAAWPLSSALGRFLITTLFKSGFDSTFELRGLFIWLAVSLFLGAIASFVPAWHATNQPVREALGYE